MSNDKDYPTIPNAELMGYKYEARDGEFARNISVDTDEETALFDFDFNDEDGKEITIDENKYWVPAPLKGTTIAESRVESAEASEATEVWHKDSAQLSLSGSYGSYKASVSKSYESEYSSSSSYWATESQSWFERYILELPTNMSDYLRADVKSNLIGGMAADKVVETYGTHYLASGKFGALWTYSQSISKYEANSKTKATEKCEASASGAKGSVSASAETSTENSETNSSESSEAYITTVGGGSYQAQDDSAYSDWVESIKTTQNYVLIDFEQGSSTDEESNQSLRAISTLLDPDDFDSEGDYEARKQELENAITDYFNQPSPAVYNLQTNMDDTVTVYRDGNSEEKKYITEYPNEVLVGFGAKVGSDGDVAQMLLRYLDVQTGILSYSTKGKNASTHPEDYEKYVEVPTGCAMVGLGGAVDNNNLVTLFAYYQVINPRNTDQNDDNYLENTIYQVEADGSEHGDIESTYSPERGSEGMPLVGVGMDATKTALHLTLYARPLEYVTSDDDQ